MGYLGTNTPIDACYECVFEGEFVLTADGFTSPQGGDVNPKICDVVKRTCGYLRNPLKLSAGYLASYQPFSFTDGPGVRHPVYVSGLPRLQQPVHPSPEDHHEAVPT